MGRGKGRERLCGGKERERTGKMGVKNQGKQKAKGKRLEFGGRENENVRKRNRKIRDRSLTKISARQKVCF